MNHLQPRPELNRDGPSGPLPSELDPPPLRSLRVLLLGLSPHAARSLEPLLGERLPNLERAELDAIQPAQVSRAHYDLVVVEDRDAEGGHADSLWMWLAKLGLPYLVVSGAPDERRAERARRSGACGYLEWPSRWNELEEVLARVASGEASGVERRSQLLADGAEWEDPRMVALGARARRLARTKCRVLLRGEPGVGKSRLARLIHGESDRYAKAWIEFDGDANAEGSADLALFGAPAFTAKLSDGAVPGALEQAHGGTLYIREVAKLPLQVQVRLLRTLERGELRRSQSRVATPLDVRVVASSSEDLTEALDSGRLREDLYLELSTVELYVPPLRERPRDIEALAKQILREQNQSYGTRTRWAPDALALLGSLPWVGNIRELRRFVQRCFVGNDGPNELSSALVQQQIDHMRLSSSWPAALEEQLDGRVVVAVGESILDVERKLIEATLEHLGGDKRLAAQTLGISLKTLYTRLQRYRSEEEEPRPSA